MDESTQQAISVGVNSLIFVIALSISLNLMFSVRNLASVASEVNESVKDGSVIISSQENFNVILSGYDVISYYCNYIKPYYIAKNDAGAITEKVYNNNNVELTIKLVSGEYERSTTSGDETWEENRYKQFKDNINLNGKYKISMVEYVENGPIKMLIEKI